MVPHVKPSRNPPPTLTRPPQTIWGPGILPGDPAKGSPKLSPPRMDLRNQGRIGPKRGEFSGHCHMLKDNLLRGSANETFCRGSGVSLPDPTLPELDRPHQARPYDPTRPSFSAYGIFSLRDLQPTGFSGDTLATPQSCVTLQNCACRQGRSKGDRRAIQIQ